MENKKLLKLKKDLLLLSKIVPLSVALSFGGSNFSSVVEASELVEDASKKKNEEYSENFLKKIIGNGIEFVDNARNTSIKTALNQEKYDQYCNIINNNFWNHKIKAILKDYNLFNFAYENKFTRENDDLKDKETGKYPIIDINETLQRLEKLEIIIDDNKKPGVTVESINIDLEKKGEVVESIIFLNSNYTEVELRQYFYEWILNLPKKVEQQKYYKNEELFATIASTKSLYQPFCLSLAMDDCDIEISKQFRTSQNIYNTLCYLVSQKEMEAITKEWNGIERLRKNLGMTADLSKNFSNFMNSFDAILKAESINEKPNNKDIKNVIIFFKEYYAKKYKESYTQDVGLKECLFAIAHGSNNLEFKTTLKNTETYNIVYVSFGELKVIIENSQDQITYYVANNSIIQEDEMYKRIVNKYIGSNDKLNDYLLNNYPYYLEKGKEYYEKGKEYIIPYLETLKEGFNPDPKKAEEVKQRILNQFNN